MVTLPQSQPPKLECKGVRLTSPLIEDITPDVQLQHFWKKHMVTALTNCWRHIWDMRAEPKITHRGIQVQKCYFLICESKMHLLNELGFPTIFA